MRKKNDLMGGDTIGKVSYSDQVLLRVKASQSYENIVRQVPTITVCYGSLKGILIRDASAGTYLQFDAAAVEGSLCGY